MNDLKFTTAEDYVQIIKEIKSSEYYINESGLKIDAKSGNLYIEQPQTGSQCLPP